MSKLKSFAVIIGSALSMVAFADNSIDNVLSGNSYATYLNRYYIKKQNTGLWLAAFGQTYVNYNSNYLLYKNTDMTMNEGQKAGSNFTLSFPHLDAAIGFNEHNVGFFTDVGSSMTPFYDPNQTVPSTIIIKHNPLHIREAYVTYKFTSHFGLKVGHFLSDLGEYNPTLPLQQMATGWDEITSSVTGLEVASAWNHFNASITGYVEQKATQSTFKNFAKPNAALFHLGFETVAKQALIKADVAYSTRTLLTAGQIQYYADAALLSANLAVKLSKYDGQVQYYRVANRAQHETVYLLSGQVDRHLSDKLSAGIYGDYSTMTPFKWTAGLRSAYALNHQVTINGYLQYQKLTQMDPYPNNNVSAIVAVSVNL